MANFVELDPTAWDDNIFQKVGKQWMLICAKQGDRINLMTASWGGAGVLWNKPVTFAYIRPQRFTRGMVDAAAGYSLLFFDEQYRDQLHLCGSRSGRDIDKIAACGFTAALEGDIPYVQEASDVLLCRKLYQQDLTADSFLDPELVAQHYPGGDFHRLYVGEITKLLHRS